MGWTFVGVGSATTVSSGNVALTEPAGAQDGDLMIVAICVRGTVAITTPGTWTNAVTPTSGNTTANSTSSISGYTFAYRERSSSADATFTRTGGDLAIGRMYCYRPDSGSWAFNAAASLQLSSADTAVDVQPLNGVDSGDLVACMYAGAREETGAPSFQNYNVGLGGNYYDATSSFGSRAVNTSDPPTSVRTYHRSGDATTTGADGTLLFGDWVADGSGNMDLVGFYTLQSSARHSGAAAAFSEVAGSNTYNDTISSSVTGDDTAAGAATVNGSISDSGTGGDTVAAATTTADTISDSILGGDTVSAGLAFADTLSDSGTAGDTVAGGLLFDDTISDSATGGDTVASGAGTFAATVSDALTGADTVSATGGTALAPGVPAPLYPRIPTSIATQGTVTGKGWNRADIVPLLNNATYQFATLTASSGTTVSFPSSGTVASFTITLVGDDGSGGADTYGFDPIAPARADGDWVEIADGLGDALFREGRSVIGIGATSDGGVLALISEYCIDIVPETFPALANYRRRMSVAKFDDAGAYVKFYVIDDTVITQTDAVDADNYHYAAAAFPLPTSGDIAFVMCLDPDGPDGTYVARLDSDLVPIGSSYLEWGSLTFLRFACQELSADRFVIVGGGAGENVYACQYNVASPEGTLGAEVVYVGDGGTNLGLGVRSSDGRLVVAFRDTDLAGMSCAVLDSGTSAGVSVYTAAASLALDTAADAAWEDQFDGVQPLADGGVIASAAGSEDGPELFSSRSKRTILVRTSDLAGTSVGQSADGGLGTTADLNQTRLAYHAADGVAGMLLFVSTGAVQFQAFEIDAAVPVVSPAINPAEPSAGANITTGYEFFAFRRRGQGSLAAWSISPE